MENFQFFFESSRRSRKRFFLFFLGDVEKKFADDHPVACEVALEGVDVFVALLPDVLGDEAVGKLLRAKKWGMHADGEHFFVVRTVEDTNFAAFGNGFVDTPQVVAVQLLRAGRFERVDFASLWVDAGHDVLDGAVFPGSVHGLKDEQQRPAVLRVKHFLEVAEAGDAVLEQTLRGVLVLDAIRVARLVIL
jgi:hypothetical protein